MKTYLHGRTDFATTLKLRFRVGDLDLPQRKKRRYTSIREELDAQMCRCGRAVESRIHVVGDCENVHGGTGCVEGDENRRMRRGGVLVH